MQIHYTMFMVRRKAALTKNRHYLIFHGKDSWSLSGSGKIIINPDPANKNSGSDRMQIHNTMFMVRRKAALTNNPHYLIFHRNDSYHSRKKDRDTGGCIILSKTASIFRSRIKLCWSTVQHALVPNTPTWQLGGPGAWREYRCRSTCPSARSQNLRKIKRYRVPDMAKDSRYDTLDYRVASSLKPESCHKKIKICVQKVPVGKRWMFLVPFPATDGSYPNFSSTWIFCKTAVSTRVPVVPLLKLQNVRTIRYIHDLWWAEVN